MVLSGGRWGCRRRLALAIGWLPGRDPSGFPCRVVPQQMRGHGRARLSGLPRSRHNIRFFPTAIRGDTWCRLSTEKSKPPGPGRLSHRVDPMITARADQTDGIQQAKICRSRSDRSRCAVPERRWTPAFAIAVREPITRKFLEAIQVQLRDSAVVDSRRRTQGGHRLSRDRATTSVTDVIRIIDGRWALSPCEMSPGFVDAQITPTSSPGVCSIFWCGTRPPTCWRIAR